MSLQISRKYQEYRDFDNEDLGFCYRFFSIEATMSFQREAQTCHPFSATSVAIMDQNICSHGILNQAHIKVC